MSSHKFLTPTELLKIREELEREEREQGDSAAVSMETAKTLLSELSEAARHLSIIFEPGEFQNICVSPSIQEKQRRRWLSYGLAAAWGAPTKGPKYKR
jgi:hypothetical protein